MMRITALPVAVCATPASLQSSKAVNAVTNRLRSGQDGTETRQNLVNGTQANQQVLSSFMREETEDNQSFRLVQTSSSNGCSKTPPIVPPVGYTKSFLI